MEAKRKVVGIVGGILGLSLVGVVAQVLAAGSQIILALWLAPADFGLWATATAWTAVLLGLVNFGEVNGYLAHSHSRLSQSVKRSIRPNALLGISAILLGGIAFAYGRTELAILIMLVALNIPLQGLTNLLYAAMIKHRFRRRLAVAQLLAAAGRLLAMIAVAWSLESAVAFPLGLLVMNAAMLLGCAMALRNRHEGEETTAAPQKRNSRAWSTQAVSQSLASHADYLALSILASPAVLGLYFFAYQATVALTSVLVRPLSRTVMTELAHVDLVQNRLRLARRLMGRFVLIGLVSSLVAAVAIVALMPMLSPAWHGAAPLMLVLLASVPARLTNPITDAVQMTGGNWYRSAGVNLVDGILTFGAIVVLLPHGILYAAAGVSLCKILWSLVRVAVAFGIVGWRSVAGLLFLILGSGIGWLYVALWSPVVV